MGANFILLGSTKVVAILAIYHDLSLGLLCRVAGGLLGMATPEADAETREREFSELAEKQSSEMKAVMLDAGLDKAAREARTKEIASRYAALMEDTKSAADLRVETNANSPLASAARRRAPSPCLSRCTAKPAGCFGTASRCSTRSARGTSWRSR